MKNQITINDFNMFCDVVKCITKFVKSAKFNVSPSGLEIHGRNDVARASICSNSIVSDNEISFCFEEVSTFNKILNTIKDVHDGDYSSLKFELDGNSIRFNSKKFKNKMITQNEDKIASYVSQKLTTPLVPVFEFATKSDIIRKINNHSFIFTDPTSIRIYIDMQKDLEPNTVYATIGNETNGINNSLTLKFGLATMGTLGDRRLTIDMDRLNVFNVIPSDDITIQLMDKNVLVSKVEQKNKNGNFFNIIIYNSLRKS